MFSLHERTQRRVCRTAFVVFCALPTITVLGWIAYFHRPWSERDWEQSIEHTLHVGVDVVEVSAPQPLTRRISTLSLTDLETKSSLLGIDELLIHSADNVEAQHVTIRANQFAEIATALQIWLSSSDFADIDWHAGRVTLVGPAQQRFQFENIDIRSNTTTAGTRQIVIQCSSAPRLVIERGVSGTTHCRLDSTQAKLPAWILSDALPGARRWSKASFSGGVQLQKSRDSISGSFQGEVEGIDCQEWIGAKSLLAKANLRLEEFTWQSNRVETMQGTLATTKGLIRVELLKSLQNVLFCELADKSILELSQAVHFDKLACGFRLNSAGLTCIDPATNGPGVLITAEGKPLVMQPSYSNLPLANFVQLFFPLERDRLSATREATEMGDKLPLPETTKRK
jgi:hypothetical protein